MFRSKKILFFGLLLLVVVLSSIGIFVFSKKSQENKIPTDIRSQITSFQPYYLPKKYTLPKDFKLDKESIHYEQGTLLFSLKSPEGQIVSISQQAVPDEFSKGGNFVGKETLDSPNGDITVSYIEGRTSAFLITKDKDSFIILNSNQAISSDDIRVILSSLVKS